MEAAVVFAGLAFAINKTVSVIKALINGDRNTPVTQVLVWVVAFGALSLAAGAQVTAGFALPGFTQPLGDLEWQSLAILAWILGGSGSFLYDIRKAIDGTDSAAETPLLSD